MTHGFVDHGAGAPAAVRAPVRLRGRPLSLSPARLYGLLRGVRPAPRSAPLLLRAPGSWRSVAQVLYY